ncbi:MAG: NRDE family protein [Planctomycetota bacterium]
MCLILFAWRQHPRWQLAVAANRDEFHARRTRTAAFEGPLLAGKDLESGGTWLGVTRGGRFAAVTNVREPGVPVPPDAPSRADAEVPPRRRPRATRRLLAGRPCGVQPPARRRRLAGVDEQPRGAAHPRARALRALEQRASTAPGPRWSAARPPSPRPSRRPS